MVSPPHPTAKGKVRAKAGVVIFLDHPPLPAKKNTRLRLSFTVPSSMSMKAWNACPLIQ